MNIPLVQQHILHRAMTAENPQRYRDLHPQSVPNDLYNYHLRSLCRQGLVDKVAGKYQLSWKGKKFVEEELTIGTVRPPADKFKLYAHVIIINQENHNEVISRVRLREPFYGDRGIHGVSVRRGETVFEACFRHYKERLQIQLDSQHTSLHGIFRKINLTPDEAVFTDMLHYVLVCHQYTGKPDWKGTLAKGMSWRSIKEAIRDELQSPSPLTGIVEILQLLLKQKLTSSTFLVKEEKPILKEVPNNDY